MQMRYTACRQNLECSYFQILPRSAMRKHGLCCRPVSVCPVLCPATEDTIKLLSLPGSRIILVFLARVLVPNSVLASSIIFLVLFYADIFICILVPFSF